MGILGSIIGAVQGGPNALIGSATGKITGSEALGGLAGGTISPTTFAMNSVGLGKYSGLAPASPMSMVNAAGLGSIGGGSNNPMMVTDTMTGKNKNDGSSGSAITNMIPSIG